MVKIKESRIHRVVGKKIRYGDAMATLMSDFLRYCDEMEKHYKEDLKEWKAKAKAHKKDGTKPHPGKEPKRFTLIKSIKDLERIIKLELLLGELTKESEKRVNTEEERLEYLIRTDKEVRDLLAELWRRTHHLLPTRRE